MSQLHELSGVSGFPAPMPCKPGPHGLHPSLLSATKRPSETKHGSYRTVLLYFSIPTSTPGTTSEKRPRASGAAQASFCAEVAEVDSWGERSSTSERDAVPVASCADGAKGHEVWLGLDTSRDAGLAVLFRSQ